MEIGNIVNTVSISLTCLFFASLLINTTIGFLRGMRSSLKHLETMALALVSSFLIYLTLKDGGWFFHLFKNVLPEYNNEQGASEYIIRQILIPIIVDDSDTLTLEYILQLKPLAEGIINLMMLLLTVVFYFIFLGLYNLIYFFIRSERKRKKEDDEYKYNRVLGGVIYFTRSILTTILLFSIIGSLLFSVTGGKSNINRSKDSLDSNSFFDVHHMLSELNDKGILGILGAAKNNNNQPYYLFFADLLAKTKTKDVDSDKLIDLYPTLEFASVSRLIFDFYDLGAKYNIFKGSTEEAIQVFESDEFNEELNLIIDKYKETEFVNNFLKITYNTIKLEIEDLIELQNTEFFFYQNDKLIFHDEQSKTLKEAEAKLKLSLDFDPSLPYKVITGEKIKQSLIDLKEIFWPTNSRFSMSPITVLNINDIKLIIKSAAKSAKNVYQLWKDESKTNKVNSAINLVEDIANDIKQLDLFNEVGEKRDTVNAMYQRLTTFMFNIFNIDIKFSEEENLNFIKDINNIIATSRDLLTLYKSYNKELEAIDSDSKEIYAIENMLQEVNGKKSDAEIAYNNIINNFNRSEIINKILSSSYFDTQTEKILSKFLKKDIKLPTISNWLDEYNGEELIKKGEITIFSDSVKASFKKRIVSKALKLVDSTISSVVDVFNVINKVDLLKSDFTYYVLNSFILNAKMKDLEIIIPKEYKTKIDNIDLINRSDLKQLFKDLEKVLSYVDKTKGLRDTTEVLNLLKGPSKDIITQNPILNITVANKLVSVITHPDSTVKVKLPKAAIFNSKKENEVTSGLDYYYKSEELSKLINAINVVDLENFMNVGGKELTEKFINLNDNELDILIASSIIRFTLTQELYNYSISLKDNLVMFVDFNDNKVCEAINNEPYIKSEEIKNVHQSLKLLKDPGSNNIISINKMFSQTKEEYITKKEIVLKSRIIKTSIALSFLKGINKASATDETIKPIKQIDYEVPADIRMISLNEQTYAAYRNLIDWYIEDRKALNNGAVVRANEITNILNFIQEYNLKAIIDSQDYSQLKSKLNTNEIFIGKEDSLTIRQNKEAKKNVIINSYYLQGVVAKTILKVEHISIPLMYKHPIFVSPSQGVLMPVNLFDFIGTNPFLTLHLTMPTENTEKEIKGEVEKILESINNLELSSNTFANNSVNFQALDFLDSARKFNEGSNRITSLILMQTITQKLLEFNNNQFKIYIETTFLRPSDLEMSRKFAGNDLAATTKFLQMQYLIHLKQQGTTDDELINAASKLLIKNSYVDEDEIIRLAKAMYMFAGDNTLSSNTFKVSNLITPSSTAANKDLDVKKKLEVLSNSRIMSVSLAIFMNDTIKNSLSGASNQTLISPIELEFEKPLSNIITLDSNSKILNWIRPLGLTREFSQEKSTDELRKLLYAIYKLGITDIDNNSTFILNLEQIRKDVDKKEAVKASSILSLSFINQVKESYGIHLVALAADDIYEVLGYDKLGNKVEKTKTYKGSVTESKFESIYSYYRIEVF